MALKIKYDKKIQSIIYIYFHYITLYTKYIKKSKEFRTIYSLKLSVR